MEYTETLQQANSRVRDMILNEALLSKAVLAILCCACLILFIVALYNKKKNRWTSEYFLFICVLIFIWSLCSLIMAYATIRNESTAVNTLRLTCIILTPSFLCLHIKRQVSYKDQQVNAAVLLFAVPVCLILLIWGELIIPQAFGFLPGLAETRWFNIILYLYATVAIIRAYLLCLSVLFQMPQRARRSTRYMLVSVSAAAVAMLLTALPNEWFHTLFPQSEYANALMPMAAPVALCFMLFPLYDALYVMPASDVIVTSREFIMRGLDTAIIILNRKQEILDWNRADWGESLHLPRPLFMEPYGVYKKRMLDSKVFRVSPYNENIIIAEKDNTEAHYFMKAHEAKSTKQSYGFVLEISEITPIYTLTRQFEEIANYDMLTNMYNRNAYLSYVSKVIKEEYMPLLIYVGDVNSLKKVNDEHGHSAGDLLIKAIADAIKKALPSGAFAARVGGDEFVMLLPGGDDRIAEAFSDRVNELCGEIHNELYDTPNISWGYAIMTSVEQSYNDVFNEADKIMYEYKRARHQFRSSGLLPGQDNVTFNG